MGILAKELTKINGISIAVWHIVLAVVAIIVIALIIGAICRANRKRKKACATVADTPTATPVTEPAMPVVEAVEPTSMPVVEVIEPAVVESAEPTQEPVEDPVVEEVVDTDESADDADTDGESAEPTTETKKPTTKNYHVSLRPDGKWQVKLSKGGRAIKLFDTQADAIAFAKARAKSQDGYITIHKVDGKIRKQKY